MKEWQITLGKLREFLEEKRSSGPTMLEQLFVPPGIHLAKTTPEQYVERNSGEEGREFGQILSGLLVHSQVSEHCKAYLTDHMFLLFRFGMSTESIVGILADDEYPTGPFDLENPADFEKNRLLYIADSISSLVVPEVKQEMIQKAILWAEEWRRNYGPDKEVDELINRYSRASGYKGE